MVDVEYGGRVQLRSYDGCCLILNIGQLFLTQRKYRKFALVD